ncbi:MAG: hypothetical protein AAB463_01445 [Patescibacteria group bacterium]
MREILAKTATFVKRSFHEIFVVLCMVAIAFISYQLGLKSQESGTVAPITIEDGAQIFTAQLASQAGIGGGKTPAPQAPRDARVVVSKSSSSKKYHYSWCSGVSRIKEENKLWFDNELAAQAAGYSLADNCR